MKEGAFLPVRSVVDNPCPQWLWKATGAYQFQEQKQVVAAYSGHNVDRVILVGKEDDFAHPGTEVVYRHPEITLQKDKYQHVILVVLEFDDGSLWEKMTDMTPGYEEGSYHPSEYIKWGSAWRAHQTIGPNVHQIYLVKSCTAHHLKLHQQRLKRHVKG